MAGQRFGIGELASALPVGADEIGVAEIALGGGTVLLAARPEVAAGEAQEDGAAAALHALALQRQEGFLDRVGHDRAYRVGSAIPASSNPLARSRGVAQAAMLEVAGRVVAGPAHPGVEPEPRRLAGDVGLGHVQQRRVDGEAVPFDPGLGRLVGQGLEGGDELGRQSG